MFYHPTDVEHGIRYGASERVRDPSFTYSTQEADKIMNEIKEELSEAYEKARAIFHATEHIFLDRSTTSHGVPGYSPGPSSNSKT